MTAEGSAGEQGSALGFEQLGSWPVAELLTRMATGGAAPACGSAAAVAAGLSAALAGKVARRSSGRLAGVDDLIGRTDELRRRATELAGADAVAVHAMVTSADMPEAARTVPEEIRDLAAELAQVAARLAAHGNPALHADAVGASRLAEAARAAAEAIVASNSPG